MGKAARFSYADPPFGRAKTMILDHIGLSVSDCARSRSFFSAALAPLGISPDGHNIEAVCHRPEA